MIDAGREDEARAANERAAALAVRRATPAPLTVERGVRRGTLAALPGAPAPLPPPESAAISAVSAPATPTAPAAPAPSGGAKAVAVVGLVLTLLIVWAIERAARRKESDGR